MEIDVERFVLTAVVALVVLAIAMWKHWTEERQNQLANREDEAANSSLPVPSFVTVDASDHGDEEERPLWLSREQRPDVEPGDGERCDSVRASRRS